MPACVVEAVWIFFLVAVMTPSAFCVIVSMNDVALPDAPGLVFAVCFGLYAESWLWLVGEYPFSTPDAPVSSALV